MANLNPPDDLVLHLTHVLGVTPERARRAVSEVLDYYREPVEQFVVRRHRELQASGASNASAFEQIRAELQGWRHPAPPLSARQIRRLIYG